MGAQLHYRRAMSLVCSSRARSGYCGSQRHRAAGSKHEQVLSLIGFNVDSTCCTIVPSLRLFGRLETGSGEGNEDDAQGIYASLSVIENFLDIQPELARSFCDTSKTQVCYRERTTSLLLALILAAFHLTPVLFLHASGFAVSSAAEAHQVCRIGSHKQTEASHCFPSCCRSRAAGAEANRMYASEVLCILLQCDPVITSLLGSGMFQTGSAGAVRRWDQCRSYRLYLERFYVCRAPHTHNPATHSRPRFAASMALRCSSRC
jgi:hypothetical protein